MKRIVYLLIVLNLLISPVVSKELHGTVGKVKNNTGLTVPEFSEFAPPQYIKATPNSETLTALERGFSKIFIVSIIGIPVGLLMKEHVNLREKNNKWAQRRFNFENSLKYCQSLESDKEIKSCYKTLRRTELYKNADKTKGTIKLESKF